MKKIKLTEKNLTNIINKIINEQERDCKKEARTGFDVCDKFTEDEYVNKDPKKATKEYKACVQDVFKTYDTCKDKKAIKEQDEENYETEHAFDYTTLDKKVLDIEKRLNQLEDDYVRKIGFGDHHQHPPPL